MMKARWREAHILKVLKKVFQPYQIRHFPREKGFSLIELIISMVILAFVALSMMQLFSNLGTNHVDTDYRRTATLLAHELMEEISSKRFDELGAKDAGTGLWSAIGVDSGETSSNKLTFDDVDDFSGWTENMTGAFAGFTRLVSVIYVNSANLDSASTAANDYKRVNVRVTNGGVEYANFVTVISVIAA